MHTHLRKQPRAGFTLIELLTVIAIIGILAAILIPTVSKVRDTARRTVDSSNLREIGKAALLYANDNNGLMPGKSLDADGLVTTTTAANLKSFAAALAQYGGLNDGTLWFSGSDTTTNSTGISTILTSNKTMSTTFNGVTTLSFEAIAGLATNLPSTTPIAFTRGVKTTGTWDAQDAGKLGVYGLDGGHIVFVGGNVQFYRDLRGGDGAGALIDSAGARTLDITKTFPSTSAAILALPTATAP